MTTFVSTNPNLKVFTSPMKTGFLGTTITKILDKSIPFPIYQTFYEGKNTEGLDLKEEYDNISYPLLFSNRYKPSYLVPLCSLLYSLSEHGFCSVPTDNLTQRTKHSGQTFVNTRDVRYVAVNFQYMSFALGISFITAQVLIKKLKDLGAIKIAGKCFFVKKTRIKFKNKVSLPTNIYELDLPLIKAVLSEYCHTDIQLYDFSKGLLNESFKGFGQWMHENIYLPKYAEEHGKHFDTVEELEKFYQDNERKNKTNRKKDVSLTKTIIGDELSQKVYKVDRQTKWMGENCLRGYTPLCGTHNPENYINSTDRFELVNDLFKSAHKKDENYIPSIGACDVNGSIQRIQYAMGHNGVYPQDFSKDIYLSIGGKTNLHLVVNSFNCKHKHTNGGIRESFKTLISAVYMKPKSTFFFGMNCDKVERGAITAFEDSDATELARHAKRILDNNPGLSYNPLHNTELFKEIKEGLTNYHSTGNFLGKFVFPIETVLMAMVTLDLRSMGITAVPLYDEIFYDINEFNAKKPGIKFKEFFYQLLAKNMVVIYTTIQRNILLAYHTAFTLGNSLTAKNTDEKTNYYQPGSDIYESLLSKCDNKWHKGNSIEEEIADCEYKYRLLEDDTIEEMISYTGELQRVVISNSPLANVVPCVAEYKANIKKLNAKHQAKLQDCYRQQNNSLLEYCYGVSDGGLLKLPLEEAVVFMHQLEDIPTYLTPSNYYRRVCALVDSYEVDDETRNVVNDYLELLKSKFVEDWAAPCGIDENYNKEYRELTAKLRTDVEEAYRALRKVKIPKVS